MGLRLAANNALNAMFSVRVLLDTEEADRRFRDRTTKNPERNYKNFLKKRILPPGPALALAKKFHDLQRLKVGGRTPPSLIISMKDDQESAALLLKSLREHGLRNFKMVATSGRDIGPLYHQTFQTDMFLTRNEGDARAAINMGVAAARVYFPEGMTYSVDGKTGQIQVWFDFDGVIAGTSGEVSYKVHGFDKYLVTQFNDRSVPLEAGPFMVALQKMSAMNDFYKNQGLEEPFVLNVITARGGPAIERVKTTFRSFGVRFNGNLFYVEGHCKTEALMPWHKEGGVDLMVEDQDLNARPLAEAGMSVAMPFYPDGDEMNAYLQAQGISQLNPKGV